MKKLEEVKKQWKVLTQKDKQLVGLAAALGGSLFMRGILKHHAKKHEMEMIKLIVPKNAEVLVFVKGGR